MGTDLTAAARNLQEQIDSGGITADQADAELRRLIIEGANKKEKKVFEKLGIDELFNKRGIKRTTPAPKPEPLSPAGNAFLASVRGELDRQVRENGLHPALANAEYERRAKEVQKLSPLMQESQWNLQQQVLGGGINQAQADNELYRLVQLSGRSSPRVSDGLKLDTPTNVINTTGQVAKDAQIAGNTLSNPNQQGPLGSRTVSIDPMTGAPTVTDTLSQGNQAVLGSIQDRSLNASQVLAGLLNSGYGASLTTPAGAQGPAPMSNMEQAVFNKLTQGFDEEKKIQQDQLRQTLANRGIGVGNEAYSNEMNRFDRTWNNRFDDAKSQAVQQGVSAQFGALNPLAAIAQSGFYAPNFQQFNSVPYQQASVQDVFGQFLGAGLTREGFQHDKDMALFQKELQEGLLSGMGGGGGGGRGGGPQQPTGYQGKNPFVSGPPPGS